MTNEKGDGRKVLEIIGFLLLPGIAVIVGMVVLVANLAYFGYKAPTVVYYLPPVLGALMAIYVFRRMQVDRWG